MAVNLCEEDQDAFPISLLPREGITTMHCESQLAFLGQSQVLNTTASQKYSDPEVHCQNCINLEMEKADIYSACIVDLVDIEKGNSGIPKNTEAAEKLKIEGPFIGALQRQVSLQIGEKLMQLSVNHLALPKFTSKDKSASGKVVGSPTCRARTFKRFASFNSRKIVLMFSILSSMGSMILIYLTLRVRQLGA